MWRQVARKGVETADAEEELLVAHEPPQHVEHRGALVVDERAGGSIAVAHVAEPVITRAGAMLPFASLANAAMRGCVTQLGTRICSRLES